MDQPFVVCHMLSSLDGKIDGDFFALPEAGPALQAYGSIRSKFYHCQAIVYGATTAAGFAAGPMAQLPEADAHLPMGDYLAQPSEQDYTVVLDPQGSLCWKSGTLERAGRPKSHLIVAVTEATPNGYLSYLRSLRISYLLAGKKQLDVARLVLKLQQRFAIDRIMVAGGGVADWSFLQAGLLDEISLVIAPAADGSTSSVSIFEAAPFLPAGKPMSLRLVGVKMLDGDGLWLRYAPVPR